MAITVFNGLPASSPTPYRTVANPLVIVTPVAGGGAAVPTTGQIWPRGSHA